MENTMRKKIGLAMIIFAAFVFFFALGYYQAAQKEVNRANDFILDYQENNNCYPKYNDPNNEGGLNIDFGNINLSES